MPKSLCPGGLGMNARVCRSLALVVSLVASGFPAMAQGPSAVAQPPATSATTLVVEIGIVQEGPEPDERPVESDRQDLSRYVAAARPVQEGPRRARGQAVTHDREEPARTADHPADQRSGIETRRVEHRPVSDALPHAPGALAAAARKVRRPPSEVAGRRDDSVAEPAGTSAERSTSQRSFQSRARSQARSRPAKASAAITAIFVQARGLHDTYEFTTVVRYSVRRHARLCEHGLGTDYRSAHSGADSGRENRATARHQSQ